MRRTVILLTTLCVIGLTVNPRWVSAETNSPAAPAQRAMALEVLIIELKSGIQDEQAPALSGPSDAVAARVRQLQADGQITGMDHIRLTTVENQKAVIQSGTTAPVVAGRSFGGRGGPTQTSYQQQNFGTMLSAVAAVEGDTIVVELQIEKSQLQQHADQSQAEGEFVPPGSGTLTSQSTLRIASGRTVLASSLENPVDANSSGHLILVSARLLEPPSDAREVTANNSAKTKLRRIFMLRHAPAEDAARVVKETLDVKSSRIRISVDSRTNSLIVSAENENDLDDVEAILGRLYEIETNQPAPKPITEKKKKLNPASASSKYENFEKKKLQEELAKLQQEVLDVERIARQTMETAANAGQAYSSASDHEKAVALIHMLEAEAASRKPAARLNKIRADFEAAKRAYREMLIAQ